ncbi:bifunctional diaminohydroxyphosphoribosylaminopyrimidine deaminase/5-amino-6-(5-phosphoribosylamino)uracil reductase RibD [Oceanobacillus sp. 1P07AA]|uniref:bifunctional diaminohydroxyphosphoribosylaminopyrimidine deaminase/5-amino-6-(5-phosphoribosylamino)uracil reductase RibD n=1 Tax=Oceanobacillus sp. 1P07AA TaxID=3132293 RepID=UPI0039A52676
MTTDKQYMKLALENAKAMKGQTDPNPLVGAVIVNHNRIVGVGTHLKAGEPHAEIHALQMAGDNTKGATVYVTLEPCSHQGRTGPCARALVEAGIQRVVIATLDPNPLVAGTGVKILQDAGIEVEVGVLEEESISMNEVFNKFITQKLPFITLKAASTLDGKVATKTNHSKWITSEEAREDVHHLRNEHAAILVGIQTVLHDNPALTTRIPNGRNPIRIVLDSNLRIPLDAQLIQDKKAHTMIFTKEDVDQRKKERLESLGVEVVITSGKKQTDIQDVVNHLGRQQISSLLLEGGGNIHASFLAAGLVDKVVLYLAPKLSGGKDAPTFFEGPGIERMEAAIDLLNLKVDQVGPDFRFVGYPVFKEIND